MRVLVVDDGKTTYKLLQAYFEVTFLPNLRPDNLGSVLRSGGYDCLVVNNMPVDSAQLYIWCMNTLPNASCGRLIVREGSCLNVDLAFAHRCGISVVNTPGIHDQALQFITRHLPNKQGPVVVLGYGAVGKDVAMLQKKAHVVIHNSNYEPMPNNIITFLSLKEACKNADCLTVQIPYNHQDPYDNARNMVNLDIFRALNHGATIISISPAEVIDYCAFSTIAEDKDLQLVCCANHKDIENIRAKCCNVAARVICFDSADLRTPQEMYQRALLVAKKIKYFEQRKPINNIVPQHQLMLPCKTNICSLKNSTLLLPRQSYTKLPRNLVFVGAGIAGLTAVYDLVRNSTTPLNIHVYEKAAHAGAAASAHQGRHVTMGEGLPPPYTSGGFMGEQFPRGFLIKPLAAYPEATQKFVAAYERNLECNRDAIRRVQGLQKRLGEQGMYGWRALLKDAEPELRNAAQMRDTVAFRLYEDANILGANRAVFEESGIIFRDILLADVAKKTGIAVTKSGAVEAALEMDAITFNTQAVCTTLAQILQEKYGVMFHYNTQIKKLNYGKDNYVQSVLANKTEVTADAFIFASGAEIAPFTDADLPVHPMVGTSVTVNLCDTTDLLVPTHLAKYFTSIGMVNASVVDKPNGQGRTLRITGGFYIDPEAANDAPELKIVHSMLSRFGSTLYPDVWHKAKQEDRIIFSPPCQRSISYDGLPLIGRLGSSNTFYLGGTGKSGATVAPVTAKILVACLTGEIYIDHELAAAVAPTRFSSNCTQY